MITNAIGQKLQLGQMLIQDGALTQEQLDSALNHQRSSGNSLLLGEVLQKLNLCTEDDIMRSLAKAYGLPYAKISPKIADPKVIELLSREFLQKHAVLPLFKVRNRLSLAVNEPANVFLIEEVERVTGCEVQMVCGTAKDIRATLETHLP
jgi:type IV pilus assembly protein PilB